MTDEQKQSIINEVKKQHKDHIINAIISATTEQCRRVGYMGDDPDPEVTPEEALITMETLIQLNNDIVEALEDV